MRVLIVEDEWLEARHLAAVVCGAGHSVLGPFGTSTEALQAIEDPPDLALVDINLGGRGDGLELSETLWHVWKVPSVFTTTVAYDFIHTDAVGRLLKPFSDQEIVGTLDYVGAQIQGDVWPSIPARLELSDVAIRRFGQLRTGEPTLRD